MARDNSPQEHQRKQLERKTGRRAAYARVLIVTEGSKTEPHYFQELCSALRLPTAHVHVRQSTFGTTPSQVVQSAQALFLHGDPHKGWPKRAFDEVYAVFDRDEHNNYFEALQKTQALDGKLRNDDKRPVIFKAIASVPAFELWLLLHFCDVREPLRRDEALARLKRELPGYNKGSTGVYERTQHALTIAIERCETLATKFNAHTAPEPFTAVATLVRRLVCLKE